MSLYSLKSSSTNSVAQFVSISLCRVVHDKLFVASKLILRPIERSGGGVDDCQEFLWPQAIGVRR